MITFKASGFNQISQNEYDLFLKAVIPDILNAPCEHCGECGKLIRWGNYTKHLNIIDEDDPIHRESLRIKRIYCKNCRRTFSILPLLLIPYIRFHLKDIYTILFDFFSKRNQIESMTDLISERTVRRYAERFEKWNSQLRIKIQSLTYAQFRDIYARNGCPFFGVAPPT